MAVIDVSLAGRAYQVHVGTGLLRRAPELAAALLRKKTIPVVADANAWALHRAEFLASFEAAGYDVSVYEVASGEASKSWSELERLTDWLLAHEVERGDHVIALGGGVVGDLTGFACAILKRGCGFIQIPTTLLAQVDSSVGGKTAINTKTGKNLIGAFHQPSLVLADVALLSTLPQRELSAGFAEVIKYGILGDAAFFEWCSENADKVLNLQHDYLIEAVAKSVAAKARIVAEDERELTGSRALLNLGHTFGHAFEAETGFGDRLLHGEAVALGMACAARYSARRDLLSHGEAERIVAALDRAGLPSEVSSLSLACDGARLVKHMAHDKKMDAGTLPFVLLKGVGKAFLAKDVDLDDVAVFLDQQLVAH